MSADAEEFDGAQIPLFQTILQFRRMGAGDNVAVDAVFLSWIRPGEKRSFSSIVRQ